MTSYGDETYRTFQFNFNSKETMIVHIMTLEIELQFPMKLGHPILDVFCIFVFVYLVLQYYNTQYRRWYIGDVTYIIISINIGDVTNRNTAKIFNDNNE